MPLRLDTHAYTPAVLLKMLQATADVKSHEVAARVMRTVGGVTVSGRHVGELCGLLGGEMAAARDRGVEDYVHHRRPAAPPAPEVAVVALDGGRVQTRTPGQGPGVHGQHWREDKVACLLSMTGDAFEADPHPQPPRCFLDPPEVDRLVRELQARCGPRLEGELPLLDELALGKQAFPAAPAGGPAAAEGEGPEGPERRWPPKRTKAARTCVATMADCHGFGKQVVAEAYRRGFQAATRGAVLGDGSAWIWAQQQQWFSHLTPILDFVHALSYLYVTATAVAATVGERWQLHAGWMTACWQGRVGEVVQELRVRREAAGPYPGPGPPPATSPQAVLQRTLTYLENNAERMQYPEYRKRGLPVNSSPVESLIKEINYRVKGTEKFWDDPAGAEGILQIRAAQLSDDGRLERFVATRPGSPVRRYRNKEAGRSR